MGLLSDIVLGVAAAVEIVTSTVTASPETRDSLGQSWVANQDMQQKRDDIDSAVNSTDSKER